MKGLTVEIYHSKHDCTNGGISAKVDVAVIVGGDMPELFEAREHMPALKLVCRNIAGEEYKHLEPTFRPRGAGWMWGGNFAYSSDARFPNPYPLKIHDRQEIGEKWD